ncbi:hypothetical protein EBR96_06975 [bacterium]|nr:hypothetical protein [bacterium]
MTIEHQIAQAFPKLGMSELSGIRSVIAGGVRDFRRLAFSPGFGFDPFTEDEIVDYFTSKNRFNLSLKKERGKGILYGVPHSRIRRGFLNGLPGELRLAIVCPKLQFFKLDTAIASFLEISPFSLQIETIDDIGMGHSVFRIGANGTDIVVKQEDNSNQQFYGLLQSHLGWPTFRSQHVIGTRSWEITDYLGSNNLNQALVSGEIDDWDGLVIQLARHAVLGDVMGREDRHFENYMLQSGAILPVDTSALFGIGNEEWVERYIAGGLYEVCVLARFVESPERFARYTDLFITEYRQYFDHLASEVDIIKSTISGFFQSPGNHLNYVESRLNDPLYPRNQFHLYRSALKTMMERRIWKAVLAERVAADSSILTRSEWLKMYYLADQERVSNFFLFEMHEKSLADDFSRFGLVTPDRQAEICDAKALVDRYFIVE